jgi:4-aminobutyrate aminotransferase-like enzyme
MKRGILTQHYGNKIRIAPPLSVEEDDLLYAVDEIEKALNDIGSIDEEIVDRP